MAKRNAENERIKHRYLKHIRETTRLGEHSINRIAAALDRFDEVNGHRPFRKFHVEQASRFKRVLAEEINSRSGRPLAPSTQHAMLTAMKEFTIWLSSQPGFKKRVKGSDGEYFNLNNRDLAIATVTRERPAPTMQQVTRMLEAAPHETEIEKRDRAIIAFTILTGCRDGETATIRLKHIDIAEREITHDARVMRTKFSKTWTGWFFPVGDLPLEIVTEWIGVLVDEKGFGPDDPLFPSTARGLGEGGGFCALGLTREHWAGTGSIRDIFRAACARADLDYCNPHSFRKTLALLGEELCRGDVVALKAWSQNLGHEHLLTTLTSYGAVPAASQKEFMRTLGKQRDAVPDEVMKIARELHEGGFRPGA